MACQNQLFIDVGDFSSSSQIKLNQRKFKEAVVKFHKNFNLPQNLIKKTQNLCGGGTVKTLNLFSIVWHFRLTKFFQITEFNLRKMRINIKRVNGGKLHFSDTSLIFKKKVLRKMGFTGNTSQINDMGLIK